MDELIQILLARENLKRRFRFDGHMKKEREGYDGMHEGLAC